MAPHAAAVAALMKEFDGTLTPDQIYDALEQTALDMNPPPPIMQTAAFDFDTGFGLIQADAALENIATPSVAFAQTAVSVDEGDGTATITVQRLGSSTGAVSVDIATSDDTATAGSDYTGIAETLSWADGDSGDKTATVPITDDPDDEPAETVNLALSNPTGGAVVSTPSATLTITDNDNSTLTLATGPTPPAADVSGDPDDGVAVIQATVALSAGAEDLDVQALQVLSTAAGVNASTNDITARVYSDDNDNGQVDAGETELAQAAFTGATADLDLDGAGNAITLSAGGSATLLVIFEVANPLPSALLGLLLAPLALVLRYRRRLGTWLLLSLLLVALAGCPAVVDTTRTYTSSVTDVTVLSPVPAPDVVGLPVAGSTLSVVP